MQLLQAQSVPLRDIAVLYRAHYVTRTLEEVFRKRELPYTIYSGAQFFDRKEIKDALSYLRMIAYQDEPVLRTHCQRAAAQSGGEAYAPF